MPVNPAWSRQVAQQRLAIKHPCLLSLTFFPINEKTIPKQKYRSARQNAPGGLLSCGLDLSAHLERVHLHTRSHGARQ